jgi:hypothetical protein
MQGVALNTEDIYGISRKDNFGMILEDWMSVSTFSWQANEVLKEIYISMYRPILLRLARDLESLEKELVGIMMTSVLPYAVIPDLWEARKTLNARVTDLVRPGVTPKLHETSEVSIAQLHQKLITSEIKPNSPPSWTSERWLLPLPNALRLLKPFRKRKEKKKTGKARK